MKQKQIFDNGLMFLLAAVYLLVIFLVRPKSTLASILATTIGILVVLFPALRRKRIQRNKIMTLISTDNIKVLSRIQQKTAVDKQQLTLFTQTGVGVRMKKLYIIEAIIDKYVAKNA
ncbi:hypothetical protein ACNAN0_11365 [Agrilactobacillus fermenti]|uniref:hypothetical protein n=1 Tax=Agrilactobacillus fermenti TaxID=2586909 RepID=UPI003A5BAE36